MTTGTLQTILPRLTQCVLCNGALDDEAFGAVCGCCHADRPELYVCGSCGALIPPRGAGRPGADVLCGLCAGKALDAMCAGIATFRHCRQCHGAGNLAGVQCPRCQGYGKIVLHA